MNGRQHLNQLREIKSLTLESPSDTDTPFLLYVTVSFTALCHFSAVQQLYIFFDNNYALY